MINATPVAMASVPVYVVVSCQRSEPPSFSRRRVAGLGGTVSPERAASRSMPFHVPGTRIVSVTGLAAGAGSAAGGGAAAGAGGEAWRV